LVYFILIHLADADGLGSEKSQPDLSHVPYEFVFGILMVQELFWVVTVLSLAINFFASFADGVAETPLFFSAYYIVESQLAGHYKVES
jgi:hypothetical protein